MRYQPRWHHVLLGSAVVVESIKIKFATECFTDFDGAHGRHSGNPDHRSPIGVARTTIDN